MELKENDVKFLINKNKLKANYDNYKKLGTIYYPLKTNSNKIIVKNLMEKMDNKDGFLISNISHFKLLKDMEVDPTKMCLINVLSGESTIKYLYDNGVRFFVFDNINTLQNFISYANLKECIISLRLNIMEVFDDTLTHLGSSVIECKSMLDLIKSKCQNIGISFYLQTKIINDNNALEKMLNFIEQKFNDSRINFISIAGIKKYDEIKEDSLTKIKLTMKLNELILEPGKYLVGNTVDFITKVIRLKIIKDKTILIIKNGIYSGFLDVLLYNEKFKLSFKNNDKYIDLSYEKDSDHDYELYICGGSSDSGDIIGRMYINKKYREQLKVGTEILISDVGAYFEEFFMPYGGDINRIYMEVDNNEI